MKHDPAEEIRLINEQLDNWKIPKRATAGSAPYGTLARVRALRNHDLEVVNALRLKIVRLERQLDEAGRTVWDEV